MDPEVTPIELPEILSDEQEIDEFEDIVVILTDEFCTCTESSS